MATRTVWREKKADRKSIQQQQNNYNKNNNNDNNYGNNNNTNIKIKRIIQHPPKKITTWYMVPQGGEYLGTCGYQTKSTVNGVQRNNHWSGRTSNDR